jgi:hypothetical protein
MVGRPYGPKNRVLAFSNFPKKCHLQRDTVYLCTLPVPADHLATETRVPPGGPEEVAYRLHFCG